MSEVRIRLIEFPMRILLCISFVLFCLPPSIYAQKETTNWIFNHYLHLTVDSSGIKRQPGSMIVASEGSSSISDSHGNLLFYTDGITVWNRNNGVMENGSGLLASPSSTQAALIIKYPNSSSKYYIFSNAEVLGLYYSIVDLSQNNGLGKVVVKNILIRDSVTEQLTACQHANNTDTWILTHDYKGANFLSFLVTSEGIQPPLISNIGYSHEGPMDYISLAKFSPNGKWVATTVYSKGIAELYRFNNKCGTLCNWLPLLDNLSYFGLYGVEFSATSSKLYLSQINGHPRNIWQVDLTTDYDSVVYTINLVATTKHNNGALQLAMDGSIICAGVEYVGRIFNPDSSIQKCHYIDTFLSLGGIHPGLGLPNFNQSYFNSYPITDTVQYCECKNNEKEVNADISIFMPNPVREWLQLSLTLPQETNISFRLFDASGKLIKDFPSKYVDKGTNDIKLNLLNVSQGLYLLQFALFGEIICYKLLIL